MVTIKNGKEIDGVLKQIEVEWTNKDETSSTMTWTWEDLDAEFLQRIKEFIIRKLGP